MLRSCYTSKMIFIPSSFSDYGVGQAGPRSSPATSRNGEGIGLSALLPATGSFGFNNPRKGGFPLKVRWYFCRPEAKLLPFPTAFCSANWDAEPEWNPTVGELHHFHHQPWSNGRRPLSAFGVTYCGTPLQFAEGVQKYCPTTVDFFGLPRCCGPNIAGGAFVLNGLSPASSAGAIVLSPSRALPPAIGRFALSPVQGLLPGNIGVRDSGKLPQPVSYIAMSKPSMPWPIGSIVFVGPPPSRLNLAAFLPAQGGIGLGGRVPTFSPVAISKPALPSQVLALTGTLPQPGSIFLASFEGSQAGTSAIVLSPAPALAHNFGAFGLAGSFVAQQNGFGLNQASPPSCTPICYNQSPFTEIEDWYISGNSIVPSDPSVQPGFVFDPGSRVGTQTVRMVFTMQTDFGDDGAGPKIGIGGSCVNFGAEAFAGFITGDTPSCQLSLDGDTFSFSDYFAFPTLPCTMSFEVSFDGSTVNLKLTNETTSTVLMTLSGPYSFSDGSLVEITSDAYGMPITEVLVTDDSGTVWYDDCVGPDGLLWDHAPLIGCDL